MLLEMKDKVPRCLVGESKYFRVPRKENIEKVLRYVVDNMFWVYSGGQTVQVCGGGQGALDGGQGKVSRY